MREWQLGLTMFRDGDPGRLSWSPFRNLARSIGVSLFNVVGSETSRQRSVYMREFNNTKSNSEKFDTITKMATTHAHALTGESSIAEIDDIRHFAESFAVALWGETLYGHPNMHVSGQVLSLSEKILNLAVDPWHLVWYTIQLRLKLKSPDEPTRLEAKCRTGVDKILDGNVEKLEEYERNNPDAPLKTIRKLSIFTDGERTGPLSEFATSFGNLNIFGSFSSVVGELHSDRQ